MATARAAATNKAPSLRRRYFARSLLTGEIYGTIVRFPTVFSRRHHAQAVR
jgi:hypothetical protein